MISKGKYLGQKKEHVKNKDGEIVFTKCFIGIQCADMSVEKIQIPDNVEISYKRNQEVEVPVECAYNSYSKSVDFHLKLEDKFE